MPDGLKIGPIVRAGTHILAQFLVTLCLIAPAMAQDTGPEPVTVIDAPRSDTSDRYSEAARRAGVEPDAIYADGAFDAGIDRQAIVETDRQQSFEPALDGAWGIAIVVLVAAGLLMLWIKYGGAGVLLSGGMKDIKTNQSAPEAWKLADQEADLEGGALLARLAAIKDRREALTRLLRYSLLSAGERCETRFARSDTEREAFARLPAGFRHHDALKTMLRDAELAHYGGRDVSEETFSRNLQLGRILLDPRGSNGHAS
ncbi:MAG: hypothetical protein AAF724_21615 [Pseudomonadota bacterium]